MFFARRSVIVAMVTLLAILTSYSPSEQAQFHTRIAEADQTVIAEAGSVAQIQAAQFKETTQAKIATAAANIKAALSRTGFQTTITPPYDACVGKSMQITSLPAGSDEILEKGVGSASYSCDAERGAINNTVVLFGGKDGSIFEPPNYKADVSSGMEFGFTPSSTGDLRVDVTMSVNAKTGAAAGSATALLDLQDVILEFLLPAQIGAFIEIVKSLIFQTAAGVKTDAYIYVDTDTSRDETAALVGGHGFGATFPIPPLSQGAEFSSETVRVSLTTPITQGEKIYIGTGIRTTAFVHGWAVAYWNPGKKQETFVVSVVLTEEGLSTNDSIVISSDSFKVLQPAQTDEIVFDVQNTGSGTWRPGSDYALINTNGVNLGASPIQTLTTEVPPGRIARWVIPITAPSQAGVNWTEWQMAYNEELFGAMMAGLIIVAPEGEIDFDLLALLEEWVNELEEQISAELKEFWEDLERRFTEWLQRELERQWREFWESLCGASAMVPAALSLGAWSISRRQRGRTKHHNDRS